MGDETTPDGRRLARLRRRLERERLADGLRAELLRDAEERDSEPSVRASLSEPGLRLKVEGEAEDVERLLAQVRTKPLLTRAVDSLAPISRRMDSRGGRIAAVITGGMALLAGALKVIAWLQENGLLD